MCTLMIYLDKTYDLFGTAGQALETKGLETARQTQSLDTAMIAITKKVKEIAADVSANSKKGSVYFTAER